MKIKVIAMAGFLAAGFLMMSCSESNKAENRDQELVQIESDFDREKVELRAELQELELEIDKKIMELEAKKKKRPTQR
ncbi:hypothetical protein [Algoriphagus boritolerans]|uniref:hypothetical protein n=1 Tax=Algoriphagus boritolerans TaxID=308111 RepID=UPI000B0E21C8